MLEYGEIIELLSIMYAIHKLKFNKKEHNRLFVFIFFVLLNPRMMDYDSFMIGFCLIVFFIDYFLSNEKIIIDKVKNKIYNRPYEYCDLI